MRKSRQTVLAILLTFVLLGAAYWAGQGKPPPQPISLVVLKEAVPAGRQLTAEQLDLVELPGHSALSIYLQSPQQAIGFWTTAPLLAGDFLLPEQLSASAGGVIYPNAGIGRRLMTIELRSGDANGVYLATGNWIDLNLVPKTLKETEKTETIERVQIAAVLGTDGKLLNPPLQQGQSTVLLCLDVNQAQASRLAEAQSRDYIRISVHNEIQNPA